MKIFCLAACFFASLVLAGIYADSPEKMSAAASSQTSPFGNQPASAASRPGMVENDDYLGWRNFPPETSVEYTREKKEGDKFVNDGSLFLTLKSVSDDKAVLEMTTIKTEADKDGKAVLNIFLVPSQKKEYIHWINKNKAPIAEEYVKDEQLELNGEKYACKVHNLTLEKGIRTIVQRIWHCDKVPGGYLLVEQTTNTPGSVHVLRQRLVKFTIPQTATATASKPAKGS